MTTKTKVALAGLLLSPPLLIGLAALLILTLLVGSNKPEETTSACAPSPVLPVGAAAQAGGGLTEEQSRNAATIIGVGQQLGVPPRGMVVAIATAFQESDLINVDYGDRDSVGLFQQRTSQGWGTLAEIQDPVKASQAFYGRAQHTQNSGLLDIGGWEQMPVTVAAQAVQGSALPTAYAEHEQRAVAVVQSLLGDGQISLIANLSGACVGASACPPTNNPVEQGLTPDALIVARCVTQDYGNLTLLGVGDRGNVSDHPSGRAIDVMIPDWDTQQGNEMGWQIATWARSNAQAMGVKYVIWDAKIWSVDRNDEGWRAYGHPNGGTDPTSLHLDHVHISVYGDAAITPVAATGTWTNPLTGGYDTTSTFGDCGSLWAECHTGHDMATSVGVPVHAAAGGAVETASNVGEDSYGNLVTIRHQGGVVTYYAHLDSIAVSPGDQVQPGQRIGTVGASGNVTGPHLHFETRVNDSPVDPVGFMAKRDIPL